MPHDMAKSAPMLLLLFLKGRCDLACVLHNTAINMEMSESVT
jgi:hypothetical protein